MSKKTGIILATVVVLVVAGIWILIYPKSKNSLPTPGTNQLEIVAKPKTSDTLKTYTDPSGFSFIFPDNLSILNNELKDEKTYAQLQLAANGINGSLVLTIADSKYKTLESWVKTTKSTNAAKEVKLGSLKALEIKTDDKLLLGALDQGIFFNIQVPLNEDRDFWMNVYEKILADFSFVSPTQDSVDSSTDDVTFEGEEVVE